MVFVCFKGGFLKLNGTGKDKNRCPQPGTYQYARQDAPPRAGATPGGLYKLRAIIARQSGALLFGASALARRRCGRTTHIGMLVHSRRWVNPVFG